MALGRGCCRPRLGLCHHVALGTSPKGVHRGGRSGCHCETWIAAFDVPFAHDVAYGRDEFAARDVITIGQLDRGGAIPAGVRNARVKEELMPADYRTFGRTLGHTAQAPYDGARQL